MQHRLSTAAATATAIIVAGLSAMPNAANAEPPVPATQPVVVVADFSGSMNEADADDKGTTRIDAAKAAVKNLLTETPEGSRLGLVVYGANDDSCGDIETVNPVGDFGAAALGAKVDALQAKGNTPIGPALKHAAKELEGIEGPRSIVLVSDGEPNCEPPPACDVAKELADQGIDMTVHTIGFRLAGNDKAQETLQCIADSTGGQYTHVDSSEDLNKVLTTETNRAMQGYQSAGIEVQGGPTTDKPEDIVAGQYVVKMVSGADTGAEGSTQEVPNRRYFSIPHHEGWDVSVSATLVPPHMESGAGAKDQSRELRLAQTAVDGSYCGTNNDFDSQSGYLDRGDLTLGLEIKRDNEYCISPDGRLSFSIARHGQGWADQALDVEFTVAYHKPEGGAIGSAKDPGPTKGMPEQTTPTELAGGGSFNDAVPIQPGQTISDSVKGQERRYYAVELGYGQSLQARLDSSAFPGVNTLSVLALNPLRQRLPFENNDFTSTDGSLTKVLNDEDHMMHGHLKLPIMPGNLLGDYQQRPFSFPGTHYVVVSRSWDDDTGTKPMPYTLTVDVWGEPSEEGISLVTTPEEYAEQFGAPESDDQASADPSGEQSASTEGDSSEAKTESSDGKESKQSTETKEAKTEASGDGGFPWVPALGGTGVALVAGGGAWYGLRRRG